MGTNQTAVEIKDLSVTFSRWGQTVTVLDNLNLTIPKGQWVMLVGHNGSGKSTLLKAISRRLIPNGGFIAVGDTRIENLSSSEIAEQVFHVHQDPLMGTAPKLTLFENLMVADHQAQIEGASRRSLGCKYRKLLQPLGLADRMKQLAKYLSGGERQLIALLIAQLRPSSLILLDEPLAALDPAKAQLCLEQIKTLNDSGRTVFQVTHDPVLALSYGDRTVALRKGRIAFDKNGEARKTEDLSRTWIQEVHEE